MTDTQTLADELADLIERISWAAYRKPEQCSEIGMSTIHHNLPTILSALRRVEKLEGALREIASHGDGFGPHDPPRNYAGTTGEGHAWCRGRARQALNEGTGE